MAKKVLLYFYKSSGPGGQKKNKRETAVRAVDPGTGLSAVASEQRSQAANRKVALERLRSKLRRNSQKSRVRVPTKKPRHVREKELKAKKIRARKKSSRRAVEEE